tara:strand:- start:1565 stop:1729 length:165 start_codon:yes stop_codon:yes gene_type:complete
LLRLVHGEACCGFSGCEDGIEFQVSYPMWGLCRALALFAAGKLLLELLRLIVGT